MKNIFTLTVLLGFIVTCHECRAQSVHQSATPQQPELLKNPDVIFQDQTEEKPIWRPLVETKEPTTQATPMHRVTSTPIPRPTPPPPPAPIAESKTPEPRTSTSGIQLMSHEVAETPTKADSPTRTPTPQPDDRENLASEADINKRLESIQAQTELTEEVKKPILEAYKRALESIALITESRKKCVNLKAERDLGPESIKKAKAELAQPMSAPQESQQPTGTLTELEQTKLSEEELFNEVVKGLEAWEARSKTRSERKPQMAAIIEKTKQQIDEAKKTYEAAAVEGELPATTLARKTEQQAFLMLLEQQLEQYRIEQSRYDALTDLFPLERDLLVRKRNYYEKRLEALKTQIADSRRIESERQAREARIKLRNAHPALKELAEKNAELTENRKSAQAALQSSADMIAQIDKTFEDISKKYQDVTDKESLGALSTGVGMLLRNQRTRLPSLSAYNKQRQNSKAEITRLQLEILPLQEEREELGDLDQTVDNFIADAGTVESISETEFREMTRELLSDRRRYLDDLINDYSTLMSSYGEIDAKARLLVEKVTDYKSFIDERVLWVPSASPIGLKTVPKAINGWGDLFSLESIMMAFQVLETDVKTHPWLYLIAIAISIAVLGLSERIQKTITKLAQGTRKKVSSNVFSTLLALGLTFVSASAIPMFFWMIGGRLIAVTSDDFCIALGHATRTLALAFWSIEVFRQICRRDGIAEVLLEWSPQSMTAVRSKFLILLTTGLPMMFVTVLADGYEGGRWADSLGRITFISFCTILTALAASMLSPNGKILNGFLKQHQQGLANKTRYVWYSLSILAPVALGVLAVLGYQYTAEQLLIRLQFTFWLSMSLVIAYSIVNQWMLVARKNLAMEQAKARRTAAAAAAKQQTETGEINLPPVEAPRVDLTELNKQLVKLVQIAACVILLSGGWMIWSQVMPALQVVNRVELWSTTVQVTESVDVGDGQEKIHTVPKQEWITLGHLILACSVLIVCVIGSKNLPGLLEFALLQRLPLDHGERNAITTLCRYACLLIGVMFSCRTVGIGWSSVQWLVAALTVGLGFGLQEIFANFVSGLIILFERPIRIGDVVTIDSVTGSVSRIQIRATTITDWDRKEYIVPNKEFVTGRLLNWTLSDKTNRIIINVGVAYGSDTDRALELLLKIANENPAVLSDPAPSATFEGFGDSSLCLTLRAYLPNLDNRMAIISQLHRAIDLAFREEQIEIAFPQVDLHVRELPASLGLKAVKAAQADSKAA